MSAVMIVTVLRVLLEHFSRFDSHRADNTEAAETADAKEFLSDMDNKKTAQFTDVSSNMFNRHISITSYIYVPVLH